MDVSDASDSECEFVPENETVSKTKGKKKQMTPNQIEKTIRSDHFLETKNSNMAECMYCQDRIFCGTKSWTNPCTKHIHACKQYPPNVDLRQSLSDLQPKTRLSDEGSSETATMPKLSNQEDLEKALVKMLIVDKLPLSFVEGVGFRRLCKVVSPYFVIPSRDKLAAMINEATSDETPGSA